MVGEVGVEPTANGLRGHCSTTELLTQSRRKCKVESKKSQYETDKLECENQIAGLTLAIEDFKKL